MSNRASQLLSAVSLADEIRIPTEIKETVAPIVQVAESIASNLREEPALAVPEAQPLPTPIVEEPIEEYDAVKNAENLVHTLTAVDGSVLGVVALLKCRSIAGGGEGIKKMKEALAKQTLGEELTEADKGLIAKMAEFRTNMDYLYGKMSVSEKEEEKLIRIATSWCEETRFEMGPATAFFANYFGSLTGRITEIIMH